MTIYPQWKTAKKNSHIYNECIVFGNLRLINIKTKTNILKFSFLCFRFLSNSWKILRFDPCLIASFLSQTNFRTNTVRIHLIQSILRLRLRLEKIYFSNIYIGTHRRFSIPSHVNLSLVIPIN